MRGNTLELDHAATGEACSKDDLKAQIARTNISKKGLSMTVKLTKTQPKRTDSMVASVLKTAQEIAARKVTIDVSDKAYRPDTTQIASWLIFPEDATTKKLSVGLNEQAIRDYLTSIQKDVYLEPGKTLIATTDGIETSRVEGTPGRGIDLNATTARVTKQLTTGDGAVVADIKSVAPTPVYTRSYSNTPAGLQSLVTDLTKDKDAAISVRKLGDAGVHANGDKQYHPASTYKLYVAYSVLKRIDDGRMTWGQVTGTGQNVSDCFDNMIVNSDNDCAEWFGGTAVGWGPLTSELRALGLSSTTINRPFVTTTNDMATFLQKLESNQLGLTEASRARLLDAMKRQRYRSGIPAGVSSPVADKVGFLDGLLHDAALIYSPNGVYVMVIMTNNLSWGAIADMARAIDAQMSQTAPAPSSPTQ